MTAAAVELSTKHGHNFSHILYQVFLKTSLESGIDDQHFGAKLLAEGKDSLSPKAQETILMSQHQALDFP